MKKILMSTRSHLLAFISFFVTIYLITLLLFSHITINGFTLLQIITKNRLWASPGGFGHSLTRFRELEQFHNIDILFLGSSHSYRAFDPRLFAKQGLTSFNMGSSSQSPLNSYYLLKRYLDTLKPRIVVYEIYFRMFEVDGLESFYDLCTNLPLSKEILEMALAIKHPHSINTLIATLLTRVTQPLYKAKQMEIPGERYVSGGYVENRFRLQSHFFGNPYKIVTSDIQLEYFRKIIAYLQRKKCRVILVTQPMPKEYLQTIVNYDSFSQLMAKLALKLDVPYYDFNYSTNFATYGDFKDYQHLNQFGVVKFNQILINTLMRAA